MSNIPIVILNHNRLVTTERLTDQLTLLGYDNIYILDSGSSYKPLLEWYKTCPYEVILADNIGHTGLWTAGYIKQFQNWPFIAISDSDIELNINTPKGFIEQMILVAKDYYVDKVGLAIEYKDITNETYKNVVTSIEARYWKSKIVDLTGAVTGNERELYHALVDTSFCIVNPMHHYHWNGIRVAGDYTCRHTPWYQDFSNLTEEEQYYYNTADPRFATCLKHYNEWKESHL